MSFEFTHEGTVYHVHTVVGAGPTRVVVDECEQPCPEQSLDSSEEPVNG